MKSDIPCFILEQYLLNELPPKQMAALTARVVAEPELQTRLKKLQQSNTRLLNYYPANEMLTKIHDKAGLPTPERKTRPIWNRFAFPAVSMAAAALVLLIAWPALQTNLFHTGETTRIKGDDARLYVYRKNGTTIDLLKNNSLAHAGDLLQIAYLADKDRFGVIVSIDGAQQVTLHFPRTPNESTRLSNTKKILLPNAYELDDAPEFERFFFITSPKKMNSKKIIQAAERLSQNEAQLKTAPLNLKKGWHQTSLLLRKDAQK